MSIKRLFTKLLNSGPFTEGSETDPAAATVLADSGAVDLAGRYRVHIGIGASVAAVFAVQHRNAANDDNVAEPMIKRAPAGASSEFLWTFYLAEGERVRVVLAAEITGDAEAAVQLERLGKHSL